MIKHIAKLFRWIFRDALTGRFLSKTEFDKRDRATTTKERIDA